MNAKNHITKACIIGAFVACNSTLAFADDLRRTVSINDHTPTVQEVEDALFPKQMEEQKTECSEIEKAGFRCQSVIPKSSLDSVQITFARGSAKLTNEAIEFLRSVGQALQRRATTWKSVVIEGHTDITGSEALNRRLSVQRADSVKQYLQTEFALNNIETVGRASEKLKDTSNPGSELNRRIEFIPNW